MATLPVLFGSIVRRRRLAAGLSQEALAERAGVHFTYVSLMERGKRAPTIVVLKKLSAALGASMAELVTELEAEDASAAGSKENGRGRPGKRED